MDPHPGRRPASCLEFFKLLSGRFRPAARRKAGGGLNRLASSPGLPADRRAWGRHPLTLGTTCTIATTGAGGGCRGRGTWPLMVQDVSAGGLGMLLARRFEAGTVLTIEFAATATTPARSVAVKVVRVRPEALGHWVHGCAFAAPLKEHELSMLL